MSEKNHLELYRSLLLWELGWNYGPTDDWSHFQSPIEELLAIAIVRAGDEATRGCHFFGRDVERSLSYHEKHTPIAHAACFGKVDAGGFRSVRGNLLGSSAEGLILSQFDEPPYKIDIAIVLEIHGRLLRVAVECDGHDFHEKTKEQARRDKKRERELTVRGWTVCRFTGSEIWADPMKSAEEAWRVVMGVVRGGAT